ncbi:MAG: M15 family metallopeptidase [Photobacterium frigidiphilum]|uniref:M15 family metallopeptidase n=1 Tax=Photobacterium frigidiphilum TaxID=264736 RepID=UPI003002359E
MNVGGFIASILLCISWQASSATVSPISDALCRNMTQAGVMDNTAPVQCQRLRQVTFNYVDFDGKQHNNGHLVVLDAVAPYVGHIFDSLFSAKFPINKAVTIEHYQGDDDRSMTDNNTSAFNYRSISGQRSLSLHAYGLAIDINPVQNPFVEFSTTNIATFKPQAGIKYANRMKYRFGKTERKGMAEEVIELFAKNGFQYWGGFWDTPIDYQHFQVSRDMANLMIAMDSQQASMFFKRYVDWYQSCSRFYPQAHSQHKFNDYVEYLKDKLGVSSLSQTYARSPSRVIQAIQVDFVRSAICVKR